jgi:hypothetical protein
MRQARQRTLLSTLLVLIRATRRQSSGFEATMPGKTETTFADGLKKILSQLAQLATAPDADINFAAQMQGMIVSYIKSQTPGAQGQSQSPQPGQPQGPSAAAGLGNSGGAMMGLNPGAPASDELSRMLGGGGGIG